MLGTPKTVNFMCCTHPRQSTSCVGINQESQLHALETPKTVNCTCRAHPRQSATHVEHTPSVLAFERGIDLGFALHVNRGHAQHVLGTHVLGTPKTVNFMCWAHPRQSTSCVGHTHDHQLHVLGTLKTVNCTCYAHPRQSAARVEHTPSVVRFERG